MTPNDYMKYTNLLFGSDNEWIVHVRNCKSYNYYYSRVLFKKQSDRIKSTPIKFNHLQRNTYAIFFTGYKPI